MRALILENVRVAKPHMIYKTADCKRVPGVTTVLGVLNKPALVSWANRLGLEGIDSSRYVDKLASIGSLAHEMILAELQGQQLDYSAHSAEEVERAGNALRSYHAWREQHFLEPVLLETPLVSETHRFGGTPDFYGDVDGIPTLLDFKTSRGIYREHFIQVAAYRWLIEDTGRPVHRVCILQIPRTEGDTFAIHELKVTTNYWLIFENTLAIYNLYRLVGGE